MPDLSDTITTPERPILNVYLERFGGASIVTVSVADLDPEFETYPGFTEAVVEGLIREGEYDDSDGNDTICRFFTDRPEDVQRQWEKLLDEFPTVRTYVATGLWPDEEDSSG